MDTPVTYGRVSIRSPKLPYRVLVRPVKTRKLQGNSGVFLVYPHPMGVDLSKNIKNLKKIINFYRFWRFPEIPPWGYHLVPLVKLCFSRGSRVDTPQTL